MEQRFTKNFTVFIKKFGKAHFPIYLTNLKKYDKIIIEKREKEILKL